ncbi:hypothetical protein [Actinomycetospora chiangmaiensis]|uniref:hypothetical protein n=1 Tax=Actinomycetospora chiangmaiensis TaxID=402650 RepID=UPI00039C8C4C|nr:hypothetical protein [Actinomycetospora chiangmaiensis]
MTTRTPLVTLGVVAALLVLLIGANTALVGGRSGPPSPIAASAVAGTPTAGVPASAPAAAPSSPSVQGVFAGRTSDGAIPVAIAVNGGKAAAYLCDGRSVEAWLQGTVTGTTMTLSGHGGAGLTGHVDGSALFGSLNAAGQPAIPFSAAVSTPPAGVFQYRKEVNGLATRVGWVVLPDGSEAGLVDSGAARSPAPWLDPGTGTFTENGVTTTAATVTGTDTVVDP